MYTPLRGSIRSILLRHVGPCEPSHIIHPHPPGANLQTCGHSRCSTALAVAGLEKAQAHHAACRYARTGRSCNQCSCPCHRPESLNTRSREHWCLSNTQNITMHLALFPTSPASKSASKIASKCANTWAIKRINELFQVPCSTFSLFGLRHCAAGAVLHVPPRAPADRKHGTGHAVAVPETIEGSGGRGPWFLRLEVLGRMEDGHEKQRVQNRQNRTYLDIL